MRGLTHKTRFHGHQTLVAGLEQPQNLRPRMQEQDLSLKEIFRSRGVWPLIVGSPKTMSFVLRHQLRIEKKVAI